MKPLEPLSTSEQALLRGSARYLMLEMVAGRDEDAISRARSGQGGSTTTLFGRGGWSQTTSKGIGWNERLKSYSSKPDEFELFVSWQRMQAHVASVRTAPLLKEVKAYLKREQKHNHEGLAHSCPNRHADPKGNSRYHKWQDEKHLPEFRALEAQRKDLIDRTLPAHIMWEEESESLPSD